MRIAINCRSFLKKNYAGIGRYAYNLVHYLSKIDSKNQYLLYTRKCPFDFKRRIPRIHKNNFTTVVDWFEKGAGKVLKNIDIYHSPSPDFLDVDCENIIVTVHDLIYKAYPKGHTAETIDITERQFQEIIQKAKKIICCSNATLDDLMKYFSIDANTARVIHQGVDKNIFHPLDAKALKSAEKMLKKRGIDEPFILFVGTIEPRKNLKNVIDAYAQLKESGSFKGKLVIIGMKGWMGDNIFAVAEQQGLKNDIIFLGYVTDKELCYFYNCARVFVFPSFYEGFGFPIIEAFSCGTAVVTSNVSSCAEVASDAALTVDPANSTRIAEGIKQILEDKEFKKNLQIRALQRANDFSFEKTAQQTLDVYNQVYEGK